MWLNQLLRLGKVIIVSTQYGKRPAEARNMEKFWEKEETKSLAGI